MHRRVGRKVAKAAWLRSRTNLVLMPLHSSGTGITSASTRNSTHISNSQLSYPISHIPRPIPHISHPLQGVTVSLNLPTYLPDHLQHSKLRHEKEFHHSLSIIPSCCISMHRSLQNLDSIMLILSHKCNAMPCHARYKAQMVHADAHLILFPTPDRKSVV